MGWPIHRGDVDDAFLNGIEIEREVFLRAPREGLPAIPRTDSSPGMPAIAPFTVLRCLKSVPGFNDGPRNWFLRHAQGIREVGGVQSALAPALFMFYERPKEHEHDYPQCIGVIGSHVDDDLMTGNDHFMNHIVPELRQIFPYGKWASLLKPGDTFGHVGKDITLHDDRITLTQREYALSVQRITLPKERRSTPNDVKTLTKEETTALRSGFGKIAYIARNTNPMIAYPLAMQLQTLKRNNTYCIADYNTLATKTVRDADMAINLWPIDLQHDNLTIFAIGDSGFMNAGLDKTESQGGYVMGIGVAQDGYVKPFNVICWKTHKLRRRARSTLAAETQAAGESVEMGELIRSYLAEFKYGDRLNLKQRDIIYTIPMMGITDCRDLYDCVTGMGKRPSEVRLVLDIEALKEYINTEWRWVMTKQMLADPLTKENVDLYLRHVLNTGEYSYVEDPQLSDKTKEVQRLTKEARQQVFEERKSNKKSKTSTKKRKKPQQQQLDTIREQVDGQIEEDLLEDIGGGPLEMDVDFQDNATDDNNDTNNNATSSTTTNDALLVTAVTTAVAIGGGLCLQQRSRRQQLEQQLRQREFDNYAHWGDDLDSGSTHDVYEDLRDENEQFYLQRNPQQLQRDNDEMRQMVDAINIHGGEIERHYNPQTRDIATQFTLHNGCNGTCRYHMVNGQPCNRWCSMPYRHQTLCLCLRHSFWIPPAELYYDFSWNDDYWNDDNAEQRQQQQQMYIDDHIDQQRNQQRPIEIMAEQDDDIPPLIPDDSSDDQSEPDAETTDDQHNTAHTDSHDDGEQSDDTRVTPPHEEIIYRCQTCLEVLQSCGEHEEDFKCVQEHCWRYLVPFGKDTMKTFRWPDGDVTASWPDTREE